MLTALTNNSDLHYSTRNKLATGVHVGGVSPNGQANLRGRLLNQRSGSALGYIGQQKAIADEEDRVTQMQKYMQAMTMTVMDNYRASPMSSH